MVKHCRCAIPAPDREVGVAVYDRLDDEGTVSVNRGLSQGNYEMKFDGARFASGGYFYRLSTGAATAVRKMTLTR